MFCFPILRLGESGLGKSTLINTLFLTDLYPDRVVSSAQGNSLYITKPSHLLGNS